MIKVLWCLVAYMKLHFVVPCYANMTSFNWGCHMGLAEESTLSNLQRVESLCLWLKQSYKLLEMRGQCLIHNKAMTLKKLTFDVSGNGSTF